MDYETRRAEIIVCNEGWNPEDLYDDAYHQGENDAYNEVFKYFGELFNSDTVCEYLHSIKKENKYCAEHCNNMCVECLKRYINNLKNRK